MGLRFYLDSYQLNTGFLINHSNYAGSAYDRLKYGINVGPEHYYKGQKINWSGCFQEKKWIVILL